VRYGTVCPEGFLPAFSVDTEAEAKQLMAMLPLAIDGRHYAAELIDSNLEPMSGDKRIDAFVRFGLRLEAIHNQIFNKENKNGKKHK